MGEGDNYHQRHKGFIRLVGDASNPTFGIAVDDASLALHIIDPNDNKTDWALSADSDPSLYIHCSGSNAATDYIEIYHDDTDAHINAAGATALDFELAATQLMELVSTGLTINDGYTLFVGVRAAPGTTAASNWIGLEDSGSAPAGTLTNSCALYADSSGDDLDVLHADGTTDSLLT
jgi:hypothetical protein